MRTAEFRKPVELQHPEIILMLLNDVPLACTLHSAFFSSPILMPGKRVLNPRNTCRVDFSTVKQHGRLPALQSKMPLKALIKKK